MAFHSPRCNYLCLDRTTPARPLFSPLDKHTSANARSSCVILCWFFFHLRLLVHFLLEGHLVLWEEYNISCHLFLVRAATYDQVAVLPPPTNLFENSHCELENPPSSLDFISFSLWIVPPQPSRDTLESKQRPDLGRLVDCNNRDRRVSIDW